MEWLLIELIVLVILLNIRAVIVLLRFKQKKEQSVGDIDVIQQSMEEYVVNLEKENDELYRKLVDYIKVKESELNERIKVLEEKVEAGLVNAHTTEQPSDKKSAEETLNVERRDEGEQENEKISQLYKQGFSAKQIAKIVRAERGEVELVINMLEKKKRHQK